jgi:hypothetical protein
MSNIKDFHVPERPKRPAGIDKAKKYNDLKAKISQDKKLFTRELQTLQKESSGLKIGYKNGYRDGQIEVLKQLVSLLNYYLE